MEIQAINLQKILRWKTVIFKKFISYFIDLDNLTKLRLQTLIQTQMARFLPKIIEDDRENQSMKSDI